MREYVDVPPPDNLCYWPDNKWCNRTSVQRKGISDTALFPVCATHTPLKVKSPVWPTTFDTPSCWVMLPILLLYAVVANPMKSVMVHSSPVVYLS